MPATPTRDRVNPETVKTTPLRRPEWIRVRAPSGETYEQLHTLMRAKSLHTVCEEAMCPNMGECWGSGTATFLMLGDVCTRSCVFCDIKHGKPSPMDWLEPERVAQAVKAMALKHAVITSVNRDERRDGGAPIFAMVIRRIRELHPGCSVEVLIPDFKGSLEALKIVMDARPEILNHNVETVPRLFKKIQPQDNYDWAAATLSNAKKLDPEVLTKIGHHGRAGRGDGGSQGRHARPALVGRGHPDPRAVPPAEQEALPHLALLHDGRVHRTARVRQGDRLQVGGGEPAGALVLPRRGAGARAEHRASKIVWRWGDEELVSRE